MDENYLVEDDLELDNLPEVNPFEGEPFCDAPQAIEGAQDGDD